MTLRSRTALCVVLALAAASCAQRGERWSCSAFHGDPIGVVVTREGQVLLGGKEVVLDELASKARVAVQQAGEETVQLCVEPRHGAPYADLAAIIGVLQEAGLVKVGVIQR